MSDVPAYLVPCGPGEEPPRPTIDPEGLTFGQLEGEACASCRKAWPAPRVQVGRFPGGGPARCCPECAEAVAR